MSDSKKVVNDQPLLEMFDAINRMSHKIGQLEVTLGKATDLLSKANDLQKELSKEKINLSAKIKHLIDQSCQDFD
jgi:hypothetical protein